MTSSHQPLKAHRFTGEVRRGDAVGLTYEMTSGQTGIVWLIPPANETSSRPRSLTVLGAYLACPDQQAAGSGCA